MILRGSFRFPVLNFSRERGEQNAFESDISAAQYNRSSIRLCVAVVPSHTFKRSPAAESSWAECGYIFSFTREQRRGRDFSTTARATPVCTCDIKLKTKIGVAWVLSCASNFPIPPACQRRDVVMGL